MMLKLYGFSKVNAYARGHTRDLRVLWALEEMQLPFELVGMDYSAHDLNTEAYRRLSPFEQIRIRRYHRLPSEEVRPLDSRRPRGRGAGNTLVFYRDELGGTAAA